MNRILIYTYNPFKPYKINSAKELVIRLKTPSIKKVFLDIDYDLTKLYEAISEFNPDIIIGIGQSLEKKLAVETTFRNLIKNDQEERIISETPYYLSNLPVKKMAKILGFSISSDAETRNCNFSAYCLLQKAEQQNKFPKIGFIHVPSIKYFERKTYLPRFEEMLNFLQKYKF